MTVYGDLRFLDEAVDSVLRQNFPDFEFIIVDDGTGKADIFSALAKRDSRIRIVTNPTNIGAAASANRGIAEARADFIARMDADDVCEPARLGNLVAALDEDPEIGLVGSAVTFINEKSKVIRVQPMPETDLEIRWTILFHNPFFHPSAAFRKSCFAKAGGYRTQEAVSHDHYLWFDMLPHCRAVNLREPLLRYRINPKGLTISNASNPRARTHAIREAHWREIGLAYHLYGDEPALAMSAFLRGEAIAPGKRAAAYSVIQQTLAKFLAVKSPSGYSSDKAAAPGFVSGLNGRMASEPAPDTAVALRSLKSIGEKLRRAAGKLIGR
jgi:glycosyltransferase involved in cell wall biosynthesis